ncbi:hypothetical protein AUEXF2481DRAFT_38627 [Aureobasidium subglaciale EXF-2481]|uniref:Uncharacterized protein n=1 Tax=Aureobasidium subglaciale (strain EXF-2481) TaxID=1043005 RepID=A0A074YJV6_AURSE|nr:uncharacterized protein AUEXF2481DRAFT_38627 [Aureobasidium subglaciale EXF-2481]KAI5201229.1 hypothetical protein E4T38_06169 [Aureobasidium subglaciale]KAI5219857.1 hypothetical protein E4T40_06190 [Aureobasidium subglaciale]KAI5223624.1 hypothetical protein E4T41_06007 [Aureobasidium subglaciale]KAI5260518.1 hypothetical protein E4T46_05924 [Aureobasidium subglaciale]KEQ96359.1 hypothetical protein AUEXF2481DRAFT_38627 [Aureobasidium subglaciale EXF-2481]
MNGNEMTTVEQQYLQDQKRLKNSSVSPEPKAIYNTSSLPYDIRSTISLTSRKRRCRDAFADKLLECRRRYTIYSKHPDLLKHVSSNARNRKRVNNLLRQDDFARNPYLEWSCQELMIALIQCKIPLPREGAGLRFECRLALEEAVRADRFRLMDLPKELRIMIYERALRQDEPLDTTDGWPALTCVSY